MPRPPTHQPTDGELELLKVLWDSGPAELGVVCRALRQQRPVATTTVATMLKVMLEKGLVRRRRKQGRFVWSARISRNAAKSRLLKRLIDRVFDGSAHLLVAHLVDNERLSDEDREQIRALLAGSPGKRSENPKSGTLTRKPEGPP